jgi:hypothetical protein
MKPILKYLFTAVAFSTGIVCVALADTTNGTVVGSDLLVKSKTITVADAVATQVAALTSISGVSIDRGGGVAAVVCAESTRTITSGTMRAYVFMPEFEPNRDAGAGVSYLWLPYPPLDFTIGGTTQRCHASGDKQSFSGIGRITWLADTVVVSAGTTVVLTHSVRKGMPK